MFSDTPRTVGFLAFPDFHILDLTGPLAVFENPVGERMTPRYRLHLLSTRGGLVASSCGLQIMTEPFTEPDFDTLVVVGGPGTLDAMADEALLTFIRAAAAVARRVVSICSGSAILAAAGLLDGKRVTTHWAFAAELQRRYPRVQVQADRIFIQQGSIWTSAGVTAGIDLALELLAEDFGPEASKARARELVVYHRRLGGQSQFSTLLELDPPSERIREALSFAREHLHEPLNVERLAQVTCLSPRQFARTFLAQTGQTPAKVIERLRAEAARARIESSSESMQEVANAVGFVDAERMRRAFIRVFGQPPQGIRRTARSG